MIALDTNLLVYAHRPEFSFHQRAYACLRELASGAQPFGLPFHALVEFYGVVTSARRFAAPTPAADAFAQIDAWLASPRARLLHDDHEALLQLRSLTLSAHTQGPAVHDARIAAVCLANRVTVLWSADRDFSRYPALTVKNPLVET